MKYNQLGKSRLQLSEIGFGCMSLPSEENEAIAIVHRAIDLGINFFDTADIYDKGHNEIIIGKAVKSKREKIILATKVGNQHRADGSGLDWNPSKKHILQSIDGSLQRLQTDHIDLYQLHGGTIQDNIDETIEAFEILKQQGKIRHYGISSIRPTVIHEYIARSSVESVMTQYSLLDRRPEEITLDLLHKNHIGVLVRGSVAQGLLAGKPGKIYLEHNKDSVDKAALAIRSLSGTLRSAAQTAIRYTLHHPAVTSAVVGMRTAKQLEDAVQTADTLPLTQKEIDILKSAVEAGVYKEHRS